MCVCRADRSVLCSVAVCTLGVVRELLQASGWAAVSG